MEVFNSILDRTQHKFINNVARDPQNKQVAQALVENEFRRRSRVGTCEYNRERRLPLGEFQTLLPGEVRPFQHFIGKAVVSSFQAFLGLFRCSGPLLCSGDGR